MIKASARDALSRIKRGYPPRAKMSWPLPATEQEETLEVAINSARCGGSSDLKSVPSFVVF